jgi:hypothetical protein
VADLSIDNLDLSSPDCIQYARLDGVRRIGEGLLAKPQVGAVYVILLLCMHLVTTPPPLLLLLLLLLLHCRC